MNRENEDKKFLALLAVDPIAKGNERRGVERSAELAHALPVIRHSGRMMMNNYSFKAIALIAATGFALSLASVSADAAKKKKKRHYRHDSYSQGYYPRTNAGHNQCMYDQTRYPTLDIRC